MKIEFVPATGPWVMSYRTTGTGLMFSTCGRDLAISCGLFGHGLVIGWRRRLGVFRCRKYVLGREGR